MTYDVSDQSKISSIAVLIAFGGVRFTFTKYLHLFLQKEANFTVFDLFSEIEQMIRRHYPDAKFVGNPQFRIRTLRGMQQVFPITPLWETPSRMKEIRVSWRREREDATALHPVRRLPAAAPTSASEAAASAIFAANTATPKRASRIATEIAVMKKIPLDKPKDVVEDVVEDVVDDEEKRSSSPISQKVTLLREWEEEDI